MVLRAPEHDAILWIIYIGNICLQNRRRQRHVTVLALATLGDTTQIGSFLLAKVSIYVKISRV